MSNPPAAHGRRRFLSLAALPLLPWGGTALAQAPWPNKPIRWVVPNAAGGGTDVAARILAQKVSDKLGQPILIDNRPGAGGVVAADFVAKSPADGYTFFYTVSGFAAAPALVANLPFDPKRDFLPISMTVRGNSMIVVSPKLPVKNIAELVAYSKAHPEALNYGSPSNAVTLAMEHIKSLTGARITLIPYKGSVQAFTDFVGGQIQVLIDPAVSMLPNVKAGKARALAVTGGSRDPGAPDVPTLAESGFPGFSLYSWHGLFAPARTPDAIAIRMQAVVAGVLAQPEVRERLLVAGLEPLGTPASELAAQLDKDVDHWIRIGQQIGMKPQ